MSEPPPTIEFFASRAVSQWRVCNASALPLEASSAPRIGDPTDARKGQKLPDFGWSNDGPTDPQKSAGAGLTQWC
jgi:hypothetical protein